MCQLLAAATKKTLYSLLKSFLQQFKHTEADTISWGEENLPYYIPDPRERTYPEDIPSQSTGGVTKRKPTNLRNKDSRS